MHVVGHGHLNAQRRDGETRVAVADQRLGVQAFEVWTWRLEPLAEGDRQQHDGELVVLVLSGCGKLLVDGGPQRVSAPCTLLLPPLRPFQIVNLGSAPMQMVAVCTHTPQPAS